MADKKYPKSDLPIRKSIDLLPNTFRTDPNNKFLSGVVDPFIQPGALDKLSGYVGKRYGKTFNGNDVYLDTDQTLRSRYQLEPGVTVEKDQNLQKFYDYLDLKNMVKFFGNDIDRDDKITYQEHYSWNPPIDWDKFINYSEYYWMPAGPPSVSVQGQTQSVQSTYKVNQGIGSTWLFTPDGITNNPTITLYRGQTYKFDVNSPGEPFVLRTNYDTGSLNYDPLKTYFPGDLAVYNSQLWRAKQEISPRDGSSIDIDSQDWELIDSSASLASLVYNQGVTNNSIEVGTLTFKVPNNSPDVIYYQSATNPNRLGRFIIADIDSNTFIDVEKDIVGKKYYTSSNGIELSNGLVLEFRGQVQPEKYASDTWLVEGVGKEIRLTRFADLVPPVITSDTPEILFDNQGFDTLPFDDARQYPGQKDYITINRASKDSNPWSRYNRWFHRSVLEYSYKNRDSDFDAPETARAKRPIIEFHPGIQLYQHGTVAKTTVDYVDDYTTDVFSTIEGSTGYSVDGEFLFEGARVLVTADTDSLANNKIYIVNFVIHNGVRQINLREASDSGSILDECVLVRRGKNNTGNMFFFNGTAWKPSQEKTTVNQPPLFNIFDDNGVSLGDQDTYPVTTFKGNKLVSYKVGNGTVDKELGFALSYLNIDNVGDIRFEWNFDIDSISYTENQKVYSKKINTSYFKINGNLDNGWILTNKKYLQPIVDSVIVTEETSSVVFDTVDWELLTSDMEINFYQNSVKLADDSYSRDQQKFTFNKTFLVNDVITVKVVGEIEPVGGYYEIPVGLEKNPLNAVLTSFTLGQATDHIRTSLEFDDRFTGSLPGANNLRDISDFQQNSKRFLKHSGIAASAVAMICDRQINLIKSLQFAKKQYSVFKENFLKKATEIQFTNDDPSSQVDQIIENLTKTKTINSPFSDSDMVGTGAYNLLTYTVEDIGIKTFTLSEKFDLKTLSRRAVYIYKNNSQLLNGRDYVFDSTFGFVRLTLDLNEGDVIEIKEYVSTAFSHIPATPTSIGLYKKYTPMKFLDDTYRDPQFVIQGHDGSITVAYGDYRDDLLLELEYRIYNNIKQEYDPKVFDVDANLGGYYKNALFTKDDFDSIASQEFLRWVANTNLSYTTNDYFKENETFTYTYSNMTDPSMLENIPGWWRGVYKYFYDTDRPHRCPWECLGFSEKPTWWEDEYGPAPYTSGNLILWEDIRDGIIRHGERAGTHKRYARTSIMSHLPVDADGILLSPLDSGLATNFTLINNKGSFKLGDIAPSEYAYRSSSEFPFVIMIALSLLRPFEFIISNFDRSKTKRNAVNQIVDVTSNVFITSNQITLPVPGVTQSSGLSMYISSYIKSLGNAIQSGQDILSNINVRLSSRLNGFVDKDQQKYLLDSKSPSSSSSSIFVPAENYNIIFNVSSPIASVSYSGVIFEKTEGGWIVNGYDDINPYFPYYTSIANQKDPTLSVGGVSTTYINWSENQKFNNGAIVQYRNDYFRAKETHTSTNTFESDKWTKLPELPVNGAVTAQKRRNFNKFSLNKLSYGTTLNSIQGVVDFLLGYEEYLKAQGIVFENYDPDNQVIQDFTTACKEFMYWTSHNWAVGSLITISPGAERLKISVPVGVADNLFDGFYDYNVLTDNGEAIQPQNIDVLRDFQTFVISTTNTTRGIYYLKVNYVLKEHVTIFSDRTVFNDVIFDKPTGYRQERIKVLGFRTVDWDGDYTSPGFLFDNVDIASWEPFKDYRLGDIVNYQGINYTSKYNHTSKEEFNADNWTKLDSTPTKKLIPNFDYRVNQIEDYFDVDSEGLSSSQRDLARHTVGYQTREYLQNLAEDQVTQFRIYQGFIREKGTANSLTKVFDKLGRTADTGIKLKEEWAFKLGEFGGSDQSNNIEIKLETDQFKINPQPVIVTETAQGNFADRYYRVDNSDFLYAPIPYTTSINATATDVVQKTAGYVKNTQVKYIVKNRDDILNIDINNVNENDHVWVTFDNTSWTVLRINYVPELVMTDIAANKTTITITFNKRHGLTAGDIIGLTDLGDITGFHKITSVDAFHISFEISTATVEIGFEPSSIKYPILLTKARFNDYTSIDVEHLALLSTGSKLFVDRNENGIWEVVQKNKQYSPKKLINYGTSTPLNAGKKVVYAEVRKQIVSSITGSGIVVCYLETPSGLDVKQILEPPVSFRATTTGTFGQEIALSPDNEWLVIGAPYASGIRSNYQGVFSSIESYSANDIVLYAGQLWKAKTSITGDGSTINVYSDDWEIVKNVQALETGTNEGYEQQGMISVYRYIGNQWTLQDNFVSPRADGDKLFGSKIALAKNGSNYSMVVSAPGASEEKGRVYTYIYDATDGWVLDQNSDYKGTYEPGGTFAATEMKPGRTYTIASSGTTNFGLVGAPNNSPGTVFVSLGPTEGTGTVTQQTFYPKDSVVYYAGNLWKALADNEGDGSTITIESSDWIKLDTINTLTSLPQSVSIEDDGSTLATGILTNSQLAELIKAGDKFGSSVALDYTGNTLVISAVEADGQYFANYRGNWQANFEYIQGDVVKYQNGYHRLDNIGSNAVGPDSSIRSYNQPPDSGYPWVNVGDSSSESVGKVFIYKKNELGYYYLIQTITADSLAEISDLAQTETINSGDQLGYAVSIDHSGNTLVITSPKADRNYQNQGSAYIFKYETDSSENRFRLKQKIDSYGKYPNEYFGQSVSISPSTNKIVVGANNTGYNLPIRFDESQTSFDTSKTTFKTYGGYSGAVYVYEKKGDLYFLAEKLQDDLSLNESFGYSVHASADIILVGSPDYIEPTTHGATLDFSGTAVGMVRLFRKQLGINSLEIIGQQTEKVDLESIKRIALYDTTTDTKIQDLEVYDPAKLKILREAERELSFKTPYDPATYNVGIDGVTVDSSIAWYDKNVGKLWWNISTAKWIDYEQGDTAYRLANWGKQAQGSSIDVYEWVESPLLPSEWSSVADSTEGLQLGISGQPLYPDDTVYSYKEFLNVNTGLVSETKYYYWVKNKTTIPSNTKGRTISSASVALSISDPSTVGNTYIALADSNKVFFYNYRAIVSGDTTILNIEHYTDKSAKNAIHNEYQLLTEGVADSVPPKKLETKWIDSLIGYDKQGNRVPDPAIPAKQQFGIGFRPRQSMFVNRKQILKQTIETVNGILKKQPFANIISFDNLNLFDAQPDTSLYLYDVSVSTLIDLETVGTVRVEQAQLTPNIINNEISSVNIVNPGFGYRPQEIFDQEIAGVYAGPAVTIEGDGTGAEAVCHIDGQGRVTAVVVTKPGKNYTYANVSVRRFSVLVETDNTANNYWSIYAWDNVRKSFFRSSSQGFDTRKYWSYADWWKTGYGPTSRVTTEISDVSKEPTIITEIGDLIRIKEYGSGGWAIFEKMSDSSSVPLGNYQLVGRFNGTIQLSNTLYDITTSGIGFDNNVSFDTGLYDLEPTTELRNIFKAIKEDIFIGDYDIHWNEIFFNCVRYVMHEQTYVDWAFKTSFLNATHNVGDFKTTTNYKNDNLESFESYISEVKPYRTTVREYVSRYDSIQTNPISTTDFDLPTVYSQELGKFSTINQFSTELNSYPWKYWLDNNGYSIVQIVISKPGSGYTSVPKVVIEGNGSGAIAQAFISNGKVSGVRMIQTGSGYTKTPTISLVGGNGSSTDIAKAVAVLGETKVRTFDINIKFDRINKTGYYNNFTDTQTFTANGQTAIFDLKYAPTRDKSKITITKNNGVVLGSDYTINLYKNSTDDFNVLRGRIVFNIAPDVGDIIKVTYEKNDELFDAVNRINKYYAPVEGMKGDDLGQLMTGVDFGGVQIQGTTFDVTGGWDALPWFTDSWDSVEASADYYHVCDGSTEDVTLPFIPADGQEINIYLKRAGEGTLPTIDNLQYSESVKNPPVIRIDDPFFFDGNDSSTSTSPNAQMPTFVGDGSTSVIEIGRYITTNDGDILIFRPQESDGSVTITDPNIVDTNVSGGTLSAIDQAYVTASGISAEEIQIEGGRFIGPDQVPATEENIPGQVLDSLSIKVYQTTNDGVAPIQSKVIISDGSTTTFDAGQKVFEKKSVLVYVDGIRKELGTDYNIEGDRTVEFVIAPDANKKIEIISIGLGGVSLLDYQEFVADGETGLFLTNAPYELTSSVFVTVNGVETDVQFTNSTGVVDTVGRTLVQFGIIPSSNSIIKIISLGSSTDVDSSNLSIVRVNKQTTIYNGVDRNYNLDNFVELTRDSSLSSMIVEVNDVKLNGPDTVYEIYDGTTNSYTLGQDPNESAGAILSANIKVFVNGERKTFIQDYVYDGTTKILTFTTGLLNTGDVIKIENNLRSEYSISNGDIIISNDVSLTNGDEIVITWFNEYPSMKIVSDVAVGGKVNYQLPFVPLGVDYVWVYKNGVKLIQDIDYHVSLPRGVVYLEVANTDSDTISITTFGADIYRLPSAYEINKDMLNVYRYNRYSRNEVKLAKNLNYYDQTIEVNDASGLYQPVRNRNISGVIEINGEKIEYMTVTGNVLGQLRRGVQGTAIKELHSIEDFVIDLGPREALPYAETQDRTDFIGDGSSLLIGPLDFVPIKSTVGTWNATSIPTDYGRCDVVEVFVGGKRLRKTPLTVFDETIGAISPAGDRELEAEFSVNGTDPYIRLTVPATAGTRITVIKRTGQAWYDRGTSTASAGVTLLANNTPISKFIAAKSTKLPE
jgi:hypothetical protein